MAFKFDDGVFVSPRAQVMYCLQQSTQGVLEQALGITHYHYLDGAVAAQWKIEMLEILGIQEDNELASDNLIEARRRILQVYNRMIGVA
jgi:hypothetical protein